MAILVDPAIWRHRGRLWCHCVSDASLDELHRFAERIGWPRERFQGDHYDLPEPVRLLALEHGAEEVSSRELLGRLKAAGLRLPPSSRRGAAPVRGSGV